MPVFFITGCSSGFGTEIAKAALHAGHKVVATSRNVSKLGHLKELGAHTMSLDINGSDADIVKAVKEAEGVYGTIDVLVNNSGYIFEGAIEEASNEEIQSNFHTNVFAHIAVCRAVLPIMRAKKSGAIAFMGSIAGWEGGPACGLYCAVKFALAGVATSLREEVAPLGIKVVLMEPGYFRTDFLGARKVATKNKIDDYEPILAGMRVAFQAFHNNQPGDPAKGGKFIVDALTRSGEMAGRELPRRLLIGEDAVSFVIGVLDKERKALNEWKDLSVTTNL